MTSPVVMPMPRCSRTPGNVGICEAHDLVLHGERGPDGPLGIVGVDHGGAEAGDDAVAQEVGDGAP